MSTPADDGDGAANPASHAWEAVDGSTMWTDVREDADGNILTSDAGLSLAGRIRRRRRRLLQTDAARSSRRLVRHMLRHVYLVLDCSRWSREKDPALPPARTRLETIFGLASDFVDEYYDQNPLGHLGIVLCRDGEAEMLTSLGGSPRKHKLALSAAASTELGRDGGRPESGGEFSLQNGIEVAGRSLGYAPRYGSREIVVLASALATCDPGDVLGETLPRLLAANVRVSAVSLQASVHVYKRLADETGGLSGVPLNSGHLRDLVMGHAVPPPVNASESAEKGVVCEFVEMGFPSRETSDVPTLVHTSGGGDGRKGGRGSSSSGASGAGLFAVNPAAADDRRPNRLVSLALTAYVCPRCRSRCSDLPSDCAVCGLRLILAPHLARTFHHLFPVRPFEELDEGAVIAAPADDGDVVRNGETSEDGAVNGNGKRALEPDGPISGTRGLEALPALSTSSFTPASAPSSSSTFVVTSSTRVRPEPGEEKKDDDDEPGAADSTAATTTTTTTKEITIGPSLVARSDDCDRACLGCLRIVGCRPANGEDEAPLRFRCPDCGSVFCADCDAFLHETLHNCPGCLVK